MSKSERMVQQSRTCPIRPKVKIIGCTENPIGQLFTVWSGTRYPESMDPEIIQYLYDAPCFVDYWSESPYICKEFSHVAQTICKWYPEYAGEDGRDYKNVIISIARKVIESNVPAGEAVHFNIQIDDANVAWREQLVRGRISQQFWTMSTRIMDMTTMDVNMNDSVRLIGGDKAVKVYEDTVEYIREAYRQLVAMGVPMEDIRLQPQGHTHRVYWMVPLRTLITILNKRCLSGSTRIRLADGTQKTIKEITEEYGDKSFWIYTCDEYGHIELAEAKSAGITRKNAKLLRVTLDNGKYIDCTPDHLFMMRDGTYKEAKDLSSNDSLMPLYTRLENYGKYLGGSHEEILDNRTNDWVYTHWLSTDHVEKPDEPRGDFLVRHHKDSNPLNNNPDNIMWVPFREHFTKYHNPAEVLDKLRENEEYASMMRDINSKIGKEVGTQNLVNWNKSEEAKKMHGEVNRRVWEGFSEEDYKAHTNFLRDKAKSQWSDPDSKLRKIHTKYNYEPVLKVCPICGREYEDQIQISLATGEVVSEGKDTCGSRSCAATYRNYGRYRGYNHKVVSVEELPYTEDVYDLTVNHDNHNFAVDLGDGTGVFVHNCDWIAQASLWTPIVAGVIQELRRLGLYDVISPFVGKPMVEVSYHEDYDRWYVSDYKMNADNEDRYSGRDKIPCDPLWLAYKGYQMPEHTDIEFYDYLKSLYINLWSDRYLKVLGWDRDHPEKIGKYDRPASWFATHSVD